MAIATRPPPPSGRPPVYAIAGRAFGRMNLRPIVIVASLMGAVWSLVWTAGAFIDLHGDKQNNDLKNLVTFDIILGSIYAGVAGIELFGAAAATTSRIPLVRMFVGLSVLAIAMVSGGELLRTIAHFKFENAIKDECVNESTGETVVTSFGFWGTSSHTLSQSDAVDFCNHAYDRNSYSTIVWFLLATIMSLFFASLAYSFYRQLLDPSAFRAQAPSDQVRMQNLGYGGYGQQSGYAPPQGFGGGYVPYPSFAPPPGPPPSEYVPPYEGAKLPSYGADGTSKDLEDGKEKFSDPFKDATQ